MAEGGEGGSGVPSKLWERSAGGTGAVQQHQLHSNRTGTPAVSYAARALAVELYHAVADVIMAGGGGRTVLLRIAHHLTLQ